MLEGLPFIALHPCAISTISNQPKLQQVSSTGRAYPYKLYGDHGQRQGQRDTDRYEAQQCNTRREQVWSIHSAPSLENFAKKIAMSEGADRYYDCSIILHLLACKATAAREACRCCLFSFAASLCAFRCSLRGRPLPPLSLAMISPSLPVRTTELALSRAACPGLHHQHQHETKMFNHFYFPPLLT